MTVMQKRFYILTMVYLGACGLGLLGWLPFYPWFLIFMVLYDSGMLMSAYATELSALIQKLWVRGTVRSIFSIVKPYFNGHQRFCVGGTLLHC